MITDISKYRLGNLLREVNSKKIVQVIGLQKNLVKLKNPSADVHDFKIEVSGNFPDGWGLEEIPLTEEIFLRLGFERGNPDYHNYSFYKGIFGFWADSQKKEWYWSNCGTSSSIKYLSDIQNIYFEYHKTELDVSSINVEPIPES